MKYLLLLFLSFAVYIASYMSALLLAGWFLFLFIPAAMGLVGFAISMANVSRWWL